MKLERILLPLDIRACPVDVFPVVRGFTRRREVTVILLHVINLTIPIPDNRVYEELEFEARGYLKRLARKYLNPRASTVVRVRVGRPVELILQEAAAESVDLIILPNHAPSCWARLVSFWKPGVGARVSPLVEKTLRGSNCGVLVARVNTRFNCEKEWGRPLSHNAPAPDYAGKEEAPVLDHLGEGGLALCASARQV